MTTLINLYGSSSSGKSSLMAALFTAFKLRKYTVEMCPEIVKQWAWEGVSPNKYDQYFLMGQEIKQQSRLFGKVDFAISDSPVLQNAFYNCYIHNEDNLYAPSLQYLEFAKKDGIQVENFLLYRNKPYEPKGRYQTEEESNQISKALSEYLDSHHVHYTVLKGSDYERVEEILKYLNI